MRDIKEKIDKELEGFDKDNKSFFSLQTANECIAEAKNTPIPNMLFSELWHEGEICILFSDTNLGKSILAVQIANSISQGRPIRGFRLEAKRQKVLYFDFELSKKQFENRYSDNYSNHFKWDDNFLRVTINENNLEINEQESFSKTLNKALESVIVKSEVKIVIVDNLTYLSDDTEKGKNALPLMKMLKGLKMKYNLSMLVLAHTPKRDTSRPLSGNDLAGSKQLANFMDSGFAIGESQEVGIRYLKQIKERATPKVYHGGNVIVCEIDKVDSFLQFVFIDFNDEQDHLKIITQEDKDSLRDKIIEASNNFPQLSLRQIAERCNTNLTKVQRILKDR